MKEITTIGIDLAKSVFHLYGVDRRGNKVLAKRVNREGLEKVARELPSCLIGMEACQGGHHWARLFMQYGHTVRLMAGQFVKPYVKSNKNDMIDAEAICEAVRRPNMRFVAIKTLEQQEVLTLHRIRERRVQARTALINEIRGLLTEFGIVFPQRVYAFEKGVRDLLTQEELRMPLRDWLADLWTEYQALNDQIAATTQKIEKFAKGNAMCRRVMTIPGVGVLTASGMVASIGKPELFKNGRQVAAWLGLVPRQYSSGGKVRLMGISKRGDRYLRKLLVHGARAVLHHAPRKTDATSRWILKLAQTRGGNKAVVAMANKNARRVWAIMNSQDNYKEAA